MTIKKNACVFPPDQTKQQHPNSNSDPQKRSMENHFLYDLQIKFVEWDANAINEKM